MLPCLLPPVLHHNPVNGHATLCKIKVEIRVHHAIAVKAELSCDMLSISPDQRHAALDRSTVIHRHGRLLYIPRLRAGLHRHRIFPVSMNVQRINVGAPGLCVQS